MNEREAQALLRSAGCLLSGHFVLASGLHSDSYVNKDEATVKPWISGRFARSLASLMKNLEIDATIGPEKGAITLGWSVAESLHTGTARQVAGVPAFKTEDGKGFYLRPTHEPYVRGRRVAICEDILTTGGSVKKVIAMAHDLDAEVVAVAALCNRGNITAQDLGVQHLFALAHPLFPTWAADECPLCKQGVPVNTDIGHGKKFLEQQAT